MMELKEKCKDMADFFLEVFEKYWEKSDEDYPTDEAIQFALYSHNLAFQLAFAIAHDMVDISGLSESAIQDINETYDLLVAGSE